MRLPDRIKSVCPNGLASLVYLCLVTEVDQAAHSAFKIGLSKADLQ